jgi:hypothetical protein
MANKSKNAMAIQVNDVLTKHGLNTHVFSYVKNERKNLATTTFVLTFVVSCEVLGLSTPFVGSCWGHAMSKWCQYAIDDSKVCVNLPFFSIKETQSILEKPLLGPRKVGRDNKHGTKHMN